MSVAVALLAAAATSCGSDNGANKNIDVAIATLDSLANSEAQLFAKPSAAEVNGANIKISYNVADSLFDAAKLSPELMDYIVSNEMKRMGAEGTNQLTSALIKAKANLDVMVADVYGHTAEFEFTGERLRTLAKAKASQLNIPAAKAAVVDMAMTLVPNPAAHPGATVTTDIANGFLNYIITFDKPSAIAGYGQGILTARYMPWLSAHFQAGNPVITDLQGLGIDGVRITYAATGAEKEIKQSFPWRTL
jgi:hypothetical protein